MDRGRLVYRPDHPGRLEIRLPNTSWLMFNLNEDPCEFANLVHYNSHRAERKKLIARLKQWISDTCGSFAVPNN